MGEAKRKQEQFRAFGHCVYCGVICEPTRDHVPPKCLFPKPRPQNLISVPSCESCNRLAGQTTDEMFKAAISLQANPDDDETRNGFVKSGHSTLQKNRRLMREFFSASDEVWVKDEQNELRKTRAFLWKAENHDSVIERITKGLFYSVTKQSLHALNCSVEVYFYGRGDIEITSIARSLNRHVIGDNQFVYAYGVAQEDPRYSIWLYEFYETHYAGARSIPVE